MARCGSSPRMRGTDEVIDVNDLVTWFIPACAGNRVIDNSPPNPGTVHPRVCGEQASARIFFLASSGSSPRVRGTGVEQGKVYDDTRFIPACAGNRPRILGAMRPGLVHARVCGEQVELDQYRGSGHGSSPRVRGTVSYSRRSARRSRFIPACAGNRRFGPSCLLCTAVHPRVCGEQSPSAGRQAIQAGSSPRVRGTGDPARFRRGGCWFIPACAGNS